MNVSRGFLAIAPIYLIIGMLIGGYMGASQDHSLAPAHAHINLLGFTLMMIFGLYYAVFPAAAQTALAKAHFWLFQIGAAILAIMLVLLFSGRLMEEQMVPLAPLAELLVLLGVVAFTINVWRHSR